MNNHKNQIPRAGEKRGAKRGENVAKNILREFLENVKILTRAVWITFRAIYVGGLRAWL
jgi:hypothetical protein